ncbi:GNAT family N-acetyltransferase [Micromonospora polyrhachis]|uniref:GNAT superfamily N-acetyltransferase n=1 Tax=Micromonospora polyrhachis TaxID=1282883 RepID=A0A7W7SUV7_9ACTN|nr:GNAT family N-acetyltransferase [Micromonospora polyrhachis]MBB4961359.1 GNAT superfamily N-acetyltransferase [Micromonospora polyrhachis]
MITEQPRVRHATGAELDQLTTVLATAFLADPVSGWIFPDADERALRHPAFFRPFVELAMVEGLVHTTTDLAGVALWLPVDVTVPAAPDEQLTKHYETVIGVPATGRFRILDELMATHHPHHVDHQYLPFIAVRPDRQRHGVGATLLRHRFEQLDEAGQPAYLEASTARNAALYERLGFTRLPVTLDLPDGPTLYPMWRAPR